MSGMTMIQSKFGGLVLRNHKESDVVAFQSKVSRNLFEKYDVLSRVMQWTRRQSLENYMRWVIGEYETYSGGLDEFLVGGTDDD